MQVEQSLAFYMFVYEDSEDYVRACLGSFFGSILGIEIPFTVINNYPGLELPERYRFIKQEFPQVRVHNNLLNQSQARNWNQITRLALMTKKEWVGILTPDTIALGGWLEAVNKNAEKLHLINHLNFSVFRTDTIRKLGWFDERHVSGGSEDLDMYMRMEEAGFPYDRFVFRDAHCEIRHKIGNQYRDTPEKFKQFENDVTYWMMKWRKDKSKMPGSDSIYFHPENRMKNWEDVNWYPSVLDRHL